jgi:hypothetical protein
MAFSLGQTAVDVEGTSEAHVHGSVSALCFNDPLDLAIESRSVHSVSPFAQPNFRACMDRSIAYAMAAMVCYGFSDFICKQAAAAGIRADHLLMAQACVFALLGIFVLHERLTIRKVMGLGCALTALTVLAAG